MSLSGPRQGEGTYLYFQVHLLFDPLSCLNHNKTPAAAGLLHYRGSETYCSQSLELRHGYGYLAT